MFLIVSGLAELFPLVLPVRLIENKKFYHNGSFAVYFYCCTVDRENNIAENA